MIDELEIHNQFHESLSRFEEHDPHLRRLSSLQYVYKSDLLKNKSWLDPGIYLLTGGRQIGKTTFLKQLIAHFLKGKKVRQENIFFLTGELIDTHHILRRIINSFHKPDQRQVLFIDEVNYIPDWDKTVKYVADTGLTENMSIILTGSDSQIIKTAMKRFAGRRGMGDTVDFEYFPLSFFDAACLIRPELIGVCEEISLSSIKDSNKLFQQHYKELKILFDNFLLHGGFLPAINAFYSDGNISKGIFNIYTHWIAGDFLKYNKSENYLHEVLRGIQKTYGSQVSWTALAKQLSIEHHKTVSDYCQILQNIHVIHIQEAILEDKLTAAPKKNKKIHFRDPFIAHAVSEFLNHEGFESIRERMIKPEESSKLVESICIDHCKRFYPSYYISGKKGEVDLALVKENRLVPLEVKWTSQIRQEELKQISLYKNGFILGQTKEMRTIGANTIIPLIQFLLLISKGRLEL